MQHELAQFKAEYSHHCEAALQTKQQTIAQQESTIAQLTNDIDKLKLSYEKQIYDMQNDRKANIAHIKSSSEYLIKQKDMALQSKDTLIQTHKEEIKVLKVTLENRDIDFKSREKSFQQEIELLKANERSVKQHLTRNEAIIKQLQIENDNIKQKNVSLTNECKRLQDKDVHYSTVISQHNSDMNTKDITIQQLKEEIQALRNEMQSIKTQSSNNDVSLHNKIKSLEDNSNTLIDKLKQENETNKSEHAAFKTKSQMQIEELHNQLHAVNNELKAKTDLIREQQSKIELISKQSKNEMQSLHNKNAQLVTKHSKEITALQKELREQKESLVSKHREEIDRMTFQHTIQVNEIQLKLDSQMSELKLDNIHLNEKLDMYDNKVNTCVGMCDDVASCVNELSDSLLMKSSDDGGGSDNGTLQKVKAIQDKNSSLRNELRNIIIKTSANKDSLNSTGVTAGSKYSGVKKILPYTSNNSKFTVKRKSDKSNSTGRASVLKKSASQKIIITANNKK